MSLLSKIFAGNRRFFAVALLTLILGIAVDRWLLPHTDLTPAFQKIHPAQSHYEFVNPLLGIELTSGSGIPAYQEMDEQITKFVNQKIREHSAENISVYFRDLEPIRWVGIDEDEGYDPGSLLKVPVMIAYFKKAESDPEILSRKVFYGERHAVADIAGNSTEFDTLKPNRFYTTDELIHAMIANSDNDAMNILVSEIQSKDLTDIFKDLGIPFPGAPDYTISAKVYATFFRILYNSTFLNREMSEKALKLLSESSFKDGIVAGLPDNLNIPVAHKFGEHGSYTDGQLTGVELHDCGIIYDPKRNYLLCVMTRGQNLESLKGIIKDISEQVYALVQKGLSQ